MATFVFETITAAQALIVTGNRTVMGSLISPITDTLQDALRDK